MNRILALGVFLFTLLTLIVFSASCVITMSDGQGVFIFIFSIPAMAILLGGAFLFSRKVIRNNYVKWRIDYIPQTLAALIVLFFICSFIPGLRLIPESFMSFVGKTFTRATGKTPYVFFKDRASFPNKLAGELKKENLTSILFSNLDVTFAWDAVCIFGPYTNNEKAQSISKLNWNIEERSQIHFSDSINALAFIYQGRVNHVVDLGRGIADFKKLDVCLNRNQANFEIETDASGHKMLLLK